jgi:hypothetical protein
MPRNSISVIYLVESAKGLVSIQRPLVTADNYLIVLLGPVSNLKVTIPFNARILTCRSHEKSSITDFKNNISNEIENSKLTLITTDDTFNIISYSIINSLKECNPVLILFDHQKFAGLTYRISRNPIHYLKHLGLFWRFLFDFIPIEHSNGDPGYKLNIIYDKIICFDGLTSPISTTPIANIRIIILIPLICNDKYHDYINYIEAHLSSLNLNTLIATEPKIAFKLHPRYSNMDRLALSNFKFISKCVELDSQTPLEFFDLSGKTVLNLDSSFSNFSQAEVFLLAKHFGSSDLKASNMTGATDFSLKEIESVFLSVK